MIRDLAQVDARGLEILRESAIRAEAVLADLGAQGVAARPAVLAATAREVEIDDDPVAGGEAAHLAAHLRHFSRDLVAHDERDHSEPHLVGSNLHVRPTHPHVSHSHQRLVRRDGGGGHVLGGEGPAELFKHQRSHTVSSTSALWEPAAGSRAHLPGARILGVAGETEVTQASAQVSRASRPSGRDVQPRSPRRPAARLTQGQDSRLSRRHRRRHRCPDRPSRSRRSEARPWQ